MPKKSDTKKSSRPDNYVKVKPKTNTYAGREFDFDAEQSQISKEHDEIVNKTIHPDSSDLQTPSVTRDTESSKKIKCSVYLTDDELVKLKQISQKFGSSQSQAFRMMLHQFTI